MQRKVDLLPTSGHLLVKLRSCIPQLREHALALGLEAGEVHMGASQPPQRFVAGLLAVATYLSVIQQ